MKVNFFKAIAQLARSSSYVLSDMSELAVLETRLAGKSVIRIIGLALIMLVLGITTWLSLMVLVTLCLIYYAGIGLLLALSIIGLVNLILAGFSLMSIMKHHHDMTFPTLRKHLHSLKN